MEQSIIKPNLNLTERLKQSFGFWFVNLIALLAITQLTRVFILQSNWNLFLNEKFAFSLDIPISIIYILYVVVFSSIVWYLIKQWKFLTFFGKLGFVLILSGGLSNLGERIYFGYVVDYIFLLNGVLNFADFYIFIGVLLVLLSSTNSENI